MLMFGFCYGQIKLSSPEGIINFFPKQSDDNGFSLSNDISSSVQCIGNVLTLPLHWNGMDGIRAGSVIIGVAGSFLLDDEVRDLVLRNESRFNEDVLVRVGHPYSTVLYVGPAALVFYISGAVFENQWIRKTGQMLVEAVVTTGIIQIPLSITIGRARPFFNEGNTSFKLFAGTDDNRGVFLFRSLNDCI